MLRPAATLIVEVNYRTSGVVLRCRPDVYSSGASYAGSTLYRWTVALMDGVKPGVIGLYRMRPHGDGVVLACSFSRPATGYRDRWMFKNEKDEIMAYILNHCGWIPWLKTLVSDEEDRVDLFARKEGQ